MGWGGRRPDSSGQPIELVRADLTDPHTRRAGLDGIAFDAVIHFAGLKAVGETVEQIIRDAAAAWPALAAVNLRYFNPVGAHPSGRNGEDPSGIPNNLMPLLRRSRWTGTSVLEAVRGFEAASGRVVPYAIHPRRAGDLATVVADPALAFERLGWRTTRSFAEAYRDAWAWQSANPQGYRG
ncbi:hypothetical protein [Leucobacter sp. W1038]|uniref:hypothetical protein n=1 Tax=Leucobacter sp. W1038 TaxID=3438281 RepID=UPI003D974564